MNVAFFSPMLLLSCILLNLNIAHAQFARLLGSQDPDSGYVVLTLPNTEGYLIGGTTSEHISITKVDIAGNTIWSKIYSSSGISIVRAIIITPDNNFAVVGNTTGFGAGSSDIFLLKINENGLPIWAKTYGTSQEDRGFSLQNTQDGGFIIGGSVQQNSEDTDNYIIKTNSLGELLWSKSMGITGYQRCFNIQSLENGNFILTGAQENNFYTDDCGAILLSSNGNIIWARYIGGEGEEHPRIIKPTPDGGFVMVAHTKSWSGEWDMLIVKINAEGSTLWAKTYSTNNIEFVGDISVESNGDITAMGHTSIGNDFNVFLVKTDAEGTIKWSKQYDFGGVEKVSFGGDNSFQQVDDNIVFVGETYYNGGSDILFVKSSGSDENCISQPFSLSTQNRIVHNSAVNLNITSQCIVNNANFQVSELAIQNNILINCSEQSTFIASQTEICPNNCITFQDTSVKNPTSWTWTFEGGIPSSSNLQNPTICFPNTGTFNVSLIAQNAESGIVWEPATLAIQVAVENCIDFIPSNKDTLLYPTAFSPNKDSNNDYFLPLVQTSIDNFYLKIYNRGGEEVFSSQSLENGWDGTYKGYPCPIGVYVYYAFVVFSTGKKQNSQGNITLIR